MEDLVLISIQVHTLALTPQSIGTDTLLFPVWWAITFYTKFGHMGHVFIYKPTQLQDQNPATCPSNRLHRSQHRKVQDGLRPLDCSETMIELSLTKRYD